MAQILKVTLSSSGGLRFITVAVTQERVLSLHSGTAGLLCIGHYFWAYIAYKASV